MEADPRHHEIALQALGLDGAKAKGVSTPGLKEAKPDKGQPLPHAQRTHHRSVCMRLAYLAGDRWEMKFSTKEVARWNHEPCEFSQRALKRIGRYLVANPRVVRRYGRQKRPTRLRVFSDSNHADCPFTRKSTSCTVTMHGAAEQTPLWVPPLRTDVPEQ